MIRLGRLSSGLIALLVGAAATVVVACEEPQQAQGPTQWTYQNGYAQSSAQAYGQRTSFQNGYAQRIPGLPPTQTPPVTYTPLTTPQTDDQAQAQIAIDPSLSPTVPLQNDGSQVQAPVQIQTTPVPLGVQTLPPPTSTATTLPTPPQATMAVPTRNALSCTTDAQCGLGRCNVAYRKCAYPCRRSDVDCMPGNVCTGSGLCLPKGVTSVSM